MHHVYRGINNTKKEVYHGVSKDPEGRKDGSHCKGGTKALEHWNCNADKISWRTVSSHQAQSKASKVAHSLEKEYKHRLGYKNIQTRGIKDGGII